MKCPVCGKEKGAANFCPQCGFRDVIPSQEQRVRYQVMVEQARAQWLESQNSAGTALAEAERPAEAAPGTAQERRRLRQAAGQAAALLERERQDFLRIPHCLCSSDESPSAFFGRIEQRALELARQEEDPEKFRQLLQRLVQKECTKRYRGRGNVVQIGCKVWRDTWKKPLFGEGRVVRSECYEPLSFPEEGSSRKLSELWDGKELLLYTRNLSGMIETHAVPLAGRIEGADRIDRDSARIRTEGTEDGRVRVRISDGQGDWTFDWEGLWLW